MATGSPTSSPAPEGSSQRDSWIPTFTGQPSNYKEWKKRMQFYYHKMVLSKRRGEAILSIVGSLTGTAWRLVEDFDVSKAEEESAFDGLLKLLDGHFQYDDRVQLPVDFDNYFSLTRKPNQTLLSFVSAHDEYHRKLEKHNVTLPDVVQGWHLLRKANLTKEQHQLVTLRAPQLERKVVEALCLILAKTAGRRMVLMANLSTRDTSSVAMLPRTMTLTSSTTMVPLNGNLNGPMMEPTTKLMKPKKLKNGPGLMPLTPAPCATSTMAMMGRWMKLPGMMWGPTTKPICGLPGCSQTVFRFAIGSWLFANRCCRRPQCRQHQPWCHFSRFQPKVKGQEGQVKRQFKRWFTKREAGDLQVQPCSHESC